jgi:hypothetical protein
VEFCSSWTFLGPCPCNDEKTTAEEQIWLDEFIKRSTRVECRYIPSQTHLLEEGMDDLSPEKIFCKEIRDNAEGACTWFFYVTTTGAARWLALDSMDNKTCHYIVANSALNNHVFKISKNKSPDFNTLSRRGIETNVVLLE